MDSAEFFFNTALPQVYIGDVEQGLAGMEEARKEKVKEEHNVVDDAI